jgi:hypothetical protein
MREARSVFQTISVTDMWTISECSVVDYSSLFPVYFAILSVSHTQIVECLHFFFHESSSPFRFQASYSIPYSFFADSRTPWTSDQPVTGQHKHKINAYTHQTYMSWVGYEHTIISFEWAKIFHTLDRAATVTGLIACIITNIELEKNRSCPNVLYYPRIGLEGLWGTMKGLSQDGICPRRHTHLGPTECKVGSAVASANLTRFSVALLKKKE